MENFIVFIAGLCLGSFLNVCIYRFPREKSVFSPRFSFCPRCGKNIKWYDNIPLLSLILLRAKCRNCKGRISLRYFFVELLTGALFLSIYVNFGITFFSLKAAILISLCIIVSFIDIDYRSIPAGLCVVGIILGLAVSLAETLVIFNQGLLLSLPVFELPLVKSFLGLFLCIGLSYSFKLLGDFGLWVYLLWKKQDSFEGEKEALGLGDIDFLGMAGTFLGWQLGFLTFFLAPLTAVLYGLYIIAFKKSHLIAYLPFLSLGCIISIFWGWKIIAYFFSI
jgi:leader peptidase (prepilin peptidase) / N-methyltransferase